jgi:hypothetical protein
VWRGGTGLKSSRRWCIRKSRGLSPNLKRHRKIFLTGDVSPKNCISVRMIHLRRYTLATTANKNTIGRRYISRPSHYFYFFGIHPHHSIHLKLKQFIPPISSPDALRNI